MVLIPHLGSGCYQMAWHAPSKHWVSLLFQRRAVRLSVSIGLHRSQAPKQLDTPVFPPWLALSVSRSSGEKVLRPSKKVRFAQKDFLRQVRGSVVLDVHTQKALA